MIIKGIYNNFYGKYKVGKGTTIGSFCDIAGKVGKNCIIQSYVFIPKGVIIGDNVFIGPRVTFTNDWWPPSYGKHWKETKVKEGAIIGAGATILPGANIGRGAFIGAGAVVTEPVGKGDIVIGNPAKFHKTVAEFKGYYNL